MILFPTTTEAFISYQEELTGRNSSEREKEIIAAWVGVFNSHYEAGTARDSTSQDEALIAIDEFMSKHEDKPQVLQFSKVCRAWIIEAWKQGEKKSYGIDNERTETHGEGRN